MMKTHQVHVMLLTLTCIQASDLKHTGSQGGDAQLNTFTKTHTSSGNTRILRTPRDGQIMETSRPPAGRPRAQSSPPGATGSINILAGFAGKSRVLVISAPGDSDIYYRLMMSSLKPDVYCDMADRHMQQIIIFHGKGKMGGKVRRVGGQGSLVEEPLDPALVPRLMGLLKLEDGKFGMVLLRKTLQVEERYSHPVQLEAIYEAVDRTPMRRLEKARQKGFVQKCKTAGVEGRVVQMTPTISKTLTTTTLTTTLLPTSTSDAAVTSSPTPASTGKGERVPQTPTADQPHAGRRKKMDRPVKAVKKTPVGRKKHTKVIEMKRKASASAVDQAANPKKTLESFLSYFQRRRRLVVITAPHEQNHMYREQRDEYLEQVCDMALRKISIISIFGPLTTSTMKMEHYQTEQDKPLRGLPNSDLINQDLIAAFRKHLGMIYNDFNMVLTDFDMKVKQRYEVPIVMKAVFDFIDTLSTRIKEIEQQRKLAVMCKKEDKSRSLEDFLSRFRWRRRLFVISSPSDEEWAYQQQLYAINSQACHLGLRHISVLKIVGKTLDGMSGVLELYPINGSASVDREDLSAPLVQDIRNYFQISQEYFSMLLVGKDGNVKSWYPSPLWSMSVIYELVDSMQLRRQETAVQKSLGMRCPDEDYSHRHRGHGY